MRTFLKGCIVPLLCAMLMTTVGLSVATSTGCAALHHKTQGPLPPGAINQFDADTYNILITAQAAILQAKTTYGREYYGSINIAITAYNTALATYKAWHNAGGGNQGAVQAAITGMLAAVANMNKQQGLEPKLIGLCCGLPMCPDPTGCPAGIGGEQ